MKRKKHPNKEIENAVAIAISNGWRYVSAGKSAHAWGRLMCPVKKRDGCIISIWSTPRNPTAHASLIEKALNRCPHKTKGE